MLAQKITLNTMLGPDFQSRAPHVITLIGGGGKTSLMFLWARCLQEQGFSVVTTTTTKLCDETRPGFSFVQPESLDAAKLLLKNSRTADEILVLTGEVLPAIGKLSGIPSDWIDELSREYPSTVFLVEGDGSAGRSLKGHLAHEPVIPACTSLLVPVVGLDVLGKPLDSENVHRPEIFAEITGVKPGDTIDQAAVIAILLQEKGYLLQAPKSATVLPFFNKAENPPLWKAGRTLAQHLLAAEHPQIKSVLVGSVQHNCFVSLS